MIRKPTVLSQVKLYSGLEGAIVKRGKIGARAKISLTDFRNIYQDIRGTGLLLGHRAEGNSWGTEIKKVAFIYRKHNAE